MIRYFGFFLALLILGCASSNIDNSPIYRPDKFKKYIEPEIYIEDSLATKTGGFKKYVEPETYEADAPTYKTEKFKKYSTPDVVEDDSIAKKEGFKQSDFRCKPFPEASVRGGKRNWLAQVKNFKAKNEGKDLILNFDLEKGAYATVLLSELIR